MTLFVFVVIVNSFERLYDSMPRVPKEMLPTIWAAIYDLTESAPMGKSGLEIVSIQSGVPIDILNISLLLATSMLSMSNISHLNSSQS